MQNHNVNIAENSNSDLFKAWVQGIEENSRNPNLKKQLSESNKNLYYKFTDHYKELKALSRRTRRSLQKKFKHTLAGIALLLALGSTPVLGAMINVTPGAVDNNNMSGNCSLIEAIQSADANAAVDNCTAGDDMTDLGDGLMGDVVVLDGSTFPLTTYNNNSSGYNGLPVITSNITIEGNGSTILRDIPADNEFRIIEVSMTGNLAL